MITKSSLIFIFCIIILGSAGCTKEGPEGPAGPTGPPGTSGSTLKGSLVGWVTLYDQFGTMIDDKSGVTVAIDGTVPPATAITNTLGRYQIDSLKTGTYEIVFSKTGYATRRALLAFLGGTKPYIYSSYISQSCTTLPTNLSVTYYSSTAVTIACTVAPAIPSGSLRVVRVFYGKTPTVSGTNYLTSSGYSTSSTSFSVTTSINKNYFPSGSTMYVIAYGDSYNSYTIMDLTTGLGIYATLNSPASNVASYIVP
jgi:hypothetical protein